jgi:hypothetical protein
VVATIPEDSEVAASAARQLMQLLRLSRSAVASEVLSEDFLDRLPTHKRDHQALASVVNHFSISPNS